MNTNFTPFAERMRREGLNQIVIDNFQYYYDALVAGDTGLIGEQAIAPVAELPHVSELATYTGHGRAALDKIAILKLNGGLGTSMGLQSAKSLLIAREGLSFLDIIVRQTLALRTRYAVAVPLLLMNSFTTDADTRALLAHYDELSATLPNTIVQNKVPKVLRATLAPAEWPEEPDLEWCPPGHGEVYIVLASTGMLDTLLDQGIEYLFLSNADNLGATLDLGILGYMAYTQTPFLMEVARRSEADRKGGHLARHRDGRLLLREVAQCPPADLAAFGDIERYRYFNTNNIWLSLSKLKSALAEQHHVLKLPMIRNQKTLDPRRNDSPPVYQLETALGTAIQVFAGAEAVQVARDRFAPVKTCADLLGLRSDRYALDNNYVLRANPARAYTDLVVELDPRFYTLIDDFEQRFPEPVPSLRGCAALSVEGDVLFEPGSRFEGKVRVINRGDSQCRLPARHLEGEMEVGSGK